MNLSDPDNGFLGRGWAFPPAFDRYSRGAVMAEAEEDIRQSILLILGIAPGERQMLPKFGCDLSQFVFGPVDLSIRTMIETELRAALLNYEPRITVNEVAVAKDADQALGAIMINIAYTVRTTNRRYNLVYPYYLNEATGTPS